MPARPDSPQAGLKMRSLTSSPVSPQYAGATASFSSTAPASALRNSFTEGGDNDGRGSPRGFARAATTGSTGSGMMSNRYAWLHAAASEKPTSPSGSSGRRGSGVSDASDPADGRSNIQGRGSLLRKITHAQKAASAFNSHNSEDGMEMKAATSLGPVSLRQAAHAVHGQSDRMQSVLMKGGVSGNLFLGEELMGLPIFQSCSHNLMNDITATAQTQSYAPDSDIVQAGTPGQCMLLILRGTVNMYVEDHKVQRLSNGEYIGETMLLGIEDHWKANLKSESTCTICEVRREDFVTALENYPTEQRFFDKITAQNNQLEYLWAGTIEHPIDIFKGLSEHLIRRIDQSLVRRIYFPNERILVEGAPGDELYMLVRGRARIEIAGRVVRIEMRDSDARADSKGELEEEAVESTECYFDVALTRESTNSRKLTQQASKDEIASPEPAAVKNDAPVCFGELGLLGMQSVRTATVIAQSVCLVRVLYRAVFLKSLEENGESLTSMASFFEQRYNTSMKDSSAKLKEVAVFQEVGCSEEFLEFLAQHLEDRMYLEGQRIIDQNLPDDRCMYLISAGSVKVIKDGEEVIDQETKRPMKLSAGAVVGEITVLGLASKRSSTIVAAETCYTQVLHQSVVVKGLEMFPEERQKVLMMAFKKTGLTDEDCDSPREADSSSTDKKAVGGILGSAGTHRAFMKVLKASPLFASTSPRFVDEISNAAIDRIYMPGDLIIEQQTKGDSMFIMVSGQAGVFINDIDSVPGLPPDGKDGSESGKSAVTDKKSMSRVGTLNAGSITGELAMLGISQVRSATIEAETICSMWEITQEKALAILDKFSDAQKHFSDLIVKHLERTVPARVTSLSIFRGFDRKFRTLLGLYCERLVLFPGQQICREGQTGNEMFVINLGRATLEKKCVPIKTYTSGNHFGSTVMLGIHKLYLGTLLVTQTCHVLGISRSSYIQALDHYPSIQAANELKKTEKVNTEELKEAIRKTSARKMVWKRYQGMINPESQDDSDKAMSDSERLQRAFQGWRKLAPLLKQLRNVRHREKHQYRHMMDQWVEKKRQGMVRLKEKKDMEQAIKDAICADRAKQLPPTWEPFRRGRGRPDCLPPVTPEAMLRPPSSIAMTPDSSQLVEILKEWPTPRPSRFYNLKIWNVLAEHIDCPGTSPSPLLPLLTGPPNSAATAGAGSLCASPGVAEDGKQQTFAQQGDNPSADDDDETVQDMISKSYSVTSAGLTPASGRRLLGSVLGSIGDAADAQDMPAELAGLLESEADSLSADRDADNEHRHRSSSRAGSSPQEPSTPRRGAGRPPRRRPTPLA